MDSILKIESFLLKESTLNVSGYAATDLQSFKIIWRKTNFTKSLFAADAAYEKFYFKVFQIDWWMKQRKDHNNDKRTIKENESGA